MDIETKNEEAVSGEEKAFGLPKLSGLKLVGISVGIAVIAVVLVLQFTKGVFVAATVNGSLISRWSVIGELEQNSGKQALDSMITKKLIENETRNISVSDEDINKEISGIEQRIISQGGTLDDALKQQGMTREQLLDQITVQKKLEKLLADKTQVSDEEAGAYIRNNKIKASAGQNQESLMAQVKEQLQQQKFNQVAQEWVSKLKTDAKIKYYVEY